MLQNNLTNDDLIKKLKASNKIKTNIIIIILPVLIIIIIFLLSSQSLLEPPSPLNNAPAKVDKFRTAITLRREKSKGVYYRIEDLQSYLNNFSKYVSQTGNASNNNINHPPVGYTWAVGFYWTMKEDYDTLNRNIIKHDYCIVPTLIDTIHPKRVLDYFDDFKKTKDKWIYNHTFDTSSTISDQTNPKDNGQLWP